MKTILKKSLFFALVASVVSITSCSKDENDPAVNPGPTNPTDTSAVLTERTGGIIYNILAPNGFPGAWNLVGDSAVSSSGVQGIKDLQDKSYVDSALGAVFAKKWGSVSGSLFAKVNTFDYATATAAKADTAYLAATPTAQTEVLAAGDIYIVRNTRLPHNYAVVKITAVNETPSDNKDNITFTYKK